MRDYQFYCKHKTDYQDDLASKVLSSCNAVYVDGSAFKTTVV
jgi:hypothetical protein